MDTSQEWSLNLMQQDNGFLFTPAITPKQRSGMMDEAWCLHVYLSIIDEEGGEMERCPAAHLAGEHPTRLLPQCRKAHLRAVLSPLKVTKESLWSTSSVLGASPT